MSAEVEDILEKVQRVRNVAVDGDLVKKAVRFMPHAEREAKEKDLRELEGYLSPNNQLPGHTLMTADARKNMEGYRKFLRKDLAENVAPPLSPAQRDAVAKLKDEMVAKFTEGMPPEEVMHRNRPGAVGEHLRWQDAKKDFTLIYKNCQRALEPDDYSEDAANIEMHRPRMAGAPGSAPTFMADAQIPGVFAQSAQSKQNYPETFGHEYAENSPLMIAHRKEMEDMQAAHKKEMDELRAMITASSNKRKPNMSQEKREEQSRKMKERWAARKAAQNQSEEANPSGHGVF